MNHRLSPTFSRFCRVLAVATLAGGLILTGAHPAMAAGRDGYSHESTVSVPNTDWMSTIPGTRPISRLSIPATHDSGASVFGEDITETQSLSLAGQLKAGIRGWDIRLNVSLGRLRVFHGDTLQGQYFDGGVMAVADRFLSEHPKEVIFMRIKKASDSSDPIAFKVKGVLDKYQARVYQGDGKVNGSYVPLDAVRGKIVVLRDFTPSDRCGLSGRDICPVPGLAWDELDIQDKYNFTSNWQLAKKWEQIKLQLSLGNNGSADRMYVNFLSGSGGSYPFFVASGQQESATNSPRLLTGYTRGVIDTCRKHKDKCIPEFPSVDCSAGTCNVAFEGTNNLMTNELRRRGPGLMTGMVYADFPGPGLIKAIIDSNSISV